tara:strand:- start:1301 stop:2746 length:1446 start_codon:yes stop_codon:yes gene_type:complete
MNCDIITDSDSDSEKSIMNEVPKVIYEPDELNNLLLLDMKKTSNRLGTVYITGDINSFYKWRAAGCSLKVTLNNKSFECKVWENSGLSPEYVQQFDNTRCIVGGRLKAEFWKTHKFNLEVTSIKILNNDTKLEKLKELCSQKGYFINKKPINYDKVGKITIISKINTQGFDDFVNQFKVPINIKLHQITLEGEKTTPECIKAIENSQDSDLILIIRGGGDTAEISNSFDTEELFKSIKSSEVPIVTAIGHEQDKGDKLLITNVSDLDLPTPTALAKFLNCKLYEHILNKISNLIEHNEEQFEKNIEGQIDKQFRILENYAKVLVIEKFGGPILEINNETSIVIKKDEKYYINHISFDNEVQISKSDIKTKEQLLNSVNEQDIKLFEKTLKKFNKVGEKLEDYVKDCISKLNKLNIINDKFNETTGIKNSLYCTILKPTRSLVKIVQMQEILLHYKNVIEKSLNGEDETDIKETYLYISTEF